MNRIYKVIWNKARNAYIVVSEFAKGHARNTVRSRAARPAAMLRLAVLLACTTSTIAVGGPLWAQAAGTVDAGTASGTNALAVGSKSSASGKGSVAVGNSSTSSDYAVAIGDTATVGGSYTYAVNGNTGYGSDAAQAIAIGHSVTANGLQDVVIGSSNTAATPTSAYYETDKTGNNSAVGLGGRILIGHDNDATGRADNATVLGSNNVVNAPHGIAIGQNVQSGQASDSGIESNNTMVIGVNSKALSSNSIALGNGATAGNSDKNSGNANGQGAIAIGESANSTAYYTVALGHNAQATNAMSVAVGDGSQATGWTSSAVGNGAKATAISSVSMGAGAEASGDYSIAIGGQAAHKDSEGKITYSSTQATGTHSVAIGRETTAAGSDSLAMGFLASVAKGASNAIALGSESIAYGVNSVAIGAGAWVGTSDYKNNVSGGVALGAGSTVYRDFKTTDWNQLGTTWTSWMDMKNPNNSHTNAKWAATIGAVSIGSDGYEGTDNSAIHYNTRQLTGLAAGTYDTDAVNVAQWKNTMLATVGDAQGSKYNSSYGTDGVNRNLTRLYDEQLTLTGAADDGTTLTKNQLTTDANIGTIVGDNKITFRLAKDLTGLDSVTTGNTVMNSTGLTITNTDDSTKSIKLDGTSGNAVIGGVTVGQTADGVLKYRNGLSGNYDTDVEAGTYVYGLSNTKWDETKYVSGRAATEDQLYQVGQKAQQDIQNISNKIGDGTFGLTAEDGSSVQANLGDRITVKGDGTNITTKTDSGDLEIALSNNLNLSNKGSVQMGNTTINNGGVTITNMTDNSKNVSLTESGLNNGGNKITNIAKGVISKTSTDAVNGSQLYEVQTVAGQHTTVKAGSANVSVTEGTNDAGGKKYTVDLAKDVTFGSDAKQIAINGSTGTVTVGTGNNQVKLDSSDGSVTAGGVTVNNGGNGKIDGLKNTTWDSKNYTSGQAATEDQLHQVESNINTVISNADKRHTEVTVNGGTAPASDGTYTEGNLQIAQKTGSDGQKIYDLKLSNNLDLGNTGSVQMGNTTINNNGVTITNTTDAAKTVSLTESGLSNGGNKITNITKGDISKTSTDAVNGSQLYDVQTMAGQHTTVKAGSANVSVTEGTNSAGGKEYTVDLAKDVTFGSDAKQIAINGSNGTMTVGTGDNQVKLDGTNGSVTAGGVTINKGGNGKIDGLTNTTWDSNNYTSGQAATEDQLHQVESNINSAISNVDKHHTEVTVNGEAAPAAEGTYTEGNLQIAQSTGTDGQKIYDLKLSDNLSIGGAGKDGQAGTNGHMDIKGSDGTSGVSLDGQDGISIKGSDGNSSVTISGKDGVDGVNGAEGHIGLNGKDGVTDIWTTAGTPGLNGKDGETMTRVVYKDPNGDTHEAATLDDGMKYSGDSGNAAVTLNNNVQIYGGATEYADGNNIGVVASQDGDNAKLQIKLAKDLTGINRIEAAMITSDTFQSGNTTINNNGLTIKTSDTDRTISIADGNVNMGGNTVSGVADGQVAPGSTDAVNGGQLWQSDQAINKLDNRVNRVGAGAAALAALHPLDFDPDDKWDFAAGYGNYKDASAVAVGAYYRPNEDTMFSVGGSFGGGENMVNAGVSFKLGQGNHVSTSRVAMAKEIKDLRKEIEGLRSALADVAAGNRLDPTKTKLFPDIPQNHWAYNEIAQLYGNGIVQGYPDGTFGGDRMMTRYEFALMVYRQMQRGAALSDRIVNEFEPELERIRVDTISKDKDGNPVIQRVRVIKDRG